MRKKSTLTFLFIFSIIGILFATTWYEIKVKCPVCKTTNKFMTWGSYGGYIYGWPSKFQYIFWPVTESNSIYSCKKCRYSAIMWDFSVSGDTLDIIKESINGLKINMRANKDYKLIATSEKLETAELFYKLYQSEPDFWCRFYRIKGYHYDQEKKVTQARESRLKALQIAEDLLLGPANDYRKKELLIITGAMKHFTNQDSLALLDFETAKSLEYLNEDLTPNDNDQYFIELLDDYIKLINESEE